MATDTDRGKLANAQLIEMLYSLARELGETWAEVRGRIKVPHDDHRLRIFREMLNAAIFGMPESPELCEQARVAFEHWLNQAFPQGNPCNTRATQPGRRRAASQPTGGRQPQRRITTRAR
jgi:hypothetical protein